MTSSRTLITSAALAALIAGGAAAQSNTEPGTETGNPLMGTDGAVSESLAETAPPAEAGAIEADTIVLSSDDAAIGTVESAEPMGNGQAALVVNLDKSLGLPVAQVRVPAQETEEGSFELAMSQAEFVSAVNAQLQLHSNGDAAN